VARSLSFGAPVYFRTMGICGIVGRPCHYKSDPKGLDTEVLQLGHHDEVEKADRRLNLFVNRADG
jgi:hypothetical protein